MFFFLVFAPLRTALALHPKRSPARNCYFERIEMNNTLTRCSRGEPAVAFYSRKKKGGRSGAPRGPRRPRSRPSPPRGGPRWPALRDACPSRTTAQIFNEWRLRKDEDSNAKKIFNACLDVAKYHLDLTIIYNFSTKCSRNDAGTAEDPISAGCLQAVRLRVRHERRVLRRPVREPRRDCVPIS